MAQDLLQAVPFTHNHLLWPKTQQLLPWCQGSALSIWLHGDLLLGPSIQFSPCFFFLFSHWLTFLYSSQSSPKILSPPRGLPKLRMRRRHGCLWSRKGRCIHLATVNLYNMLLVNPTFYPRNRLKSPTRLHKRPTYHEWGVEARKKSNNTQKLKLKCNVCYIHSSLGISCHVVSNVPSTW